MLDRPATVHAAPRKLLTAGRLGALAVLAACSLTACSAGVTDTVSTAVQDSSSAIATARLALRQDSDGRLTRAAAATALDDALKELLANRDMVVKLAPSTTGDRATVQETLAVLDSCAAGLTTARDSLASGDGTPSRDDAGRELASAADRLFELTAKEGGK